MTAAMRGSIHELHTYLWLQQRRHQAGTLPPVLMEVHWYAGDGVKKRLGLFTEYQLRSQELVLVCGSRGQYVIALGDIKYLAEIDVQQILLDYVDKHNQ